MTIAFLISITSGILKHNSHITFFQITSAIKNDKTVYCIFTDFSNMFDQIPVNLLLTKLKKPYSISPFLINLREIYRIFMKADCNSKW